MIPVLADVTFGQTLLIIFEASLLVIWVWVLILIILDLLRDDVLSGWAKAGWVLLLLVLEVIGGLIYLMVRGDGLHRHQTAHHRKLQQGVPSVAVIERLGVERAPLQACAPRRRGAIAFGDP